MSARRKQSLVWQYFKKIDGGAQVKCLYCDRTFKNYNNTTNLSNHIKRLHSQAERPESSTSFNISSDEINLLQIEMQECSSIKKLDKSLLAMIAQDLQPLSIVENPGFKRFVNDLNPLYQLPSRKKTNLRFVTESLQPKEGGCIG